MGQGRLQQGRAPTTGFLRRSLRSQLLCWGYLAREGPPSLKMEASREPVARFWGPIPWHRGTFLVTVRFIRIQPFGGSGLYIRSCFC